MKKPHALIGLLAALGTAIGVLVAVVGLPYGRLNYTAFAGLYHGPTAYLSAQMEVDCDSSTAAVDNVCIIDPLSVAPINVAVVISNWSGAPQTFAAFNFDLFNPNATAGGIAPSIPQPGSGLIAADWGAGCNTGGKIADTASGPVGSSTSFLSCFTQAVGGDPFPAGSSAQIATETFTDNVTANTSIILTLSNAAAADDLTVGLLACDPASAPPVDPTGIVGGPCFPATLLFQTPPTSTPAPPTNTPTPTNTPLPTATNTPSGFVPVGAVPTQVTVNVDGGSGTPGGATISGSGSCVSQPCTITISSSTATPTSGDLGGLSPAAPAVDISTDAFFTPPILICYNYGPGIPNEANLRFFHFNGSTWDDITQDPAVAPNIPNPNTTTHVICGVTNSFSPFVIAGPTDPRMEKVPDGNANSVVTYPNGVSANLWLCVICGPSLTNPGEGSLVVHEKVFNVFTTPAALGLGAYEFQVEFDSFVFQSVNPTDVVFSPANVLNLGGLAGAGVARTPADCTMSITNENAVRFGCVTKGQVAGPTGTFELARLLLVPAADDVKDTFPGNDNGINTIIKDNNCELADTLGHPVNKTVGTLDFGNPLNIGGGQLKTCSDLAVTLRILEGDMNLDCIVDVADEALIAAHYGASFGSNFYNKWFDLEPRFHDLDIDIKDLQKVFGRDSSTCQAPIPAQLPIQSPFSLAN